MEMMDKIIELWNKMTEAEAQRVERIVHNVEAMQKEVAFLCFST